MSSCEISGRPQSVTSVECRDTQTNKFNPRLMIIMEAHVIFYVRMCRKACVFCNLCEKQRGHLLCKTVPKMGHEEDNYAVNNRTNTPLFQQSCKIFFLILLLRKCTYLKKKPHFLER